MVSSGLAAVELCNVVSKRRQYTDLRSVAVAALLLALMAVPVGAETSQPLKTNLGVEEVRHAVEFLPQKYRIPARACAKHCIRRFKTNKLQILCFKANCCIDRGAPCHFNLRKTRY